MTDDLGYENGELTPFLKFVGFSLMGLHAAAALAAWMFAY